MDQLNLYLQKLNFVLQKKIKIGTRCLYRCIYVFIIMCTNGMSTKETVTRAKSNLWRNLQHEGNLNQIIIYTTI